jgi:hypothetical protein
MRISSSKVKVFLREFDVCFFKEEEGFSCFGFWDEEEQLDFFAIEIKEEEAEMKLEKQRN